LQAGFNHRANPDYRFFRAVSAHPLGDMDQENRREDEDMSEPVKKKQPSALMKGINAPSIETGRRYGREKGRTRKFENRDGERREKYGRGACLETRCGIVEVGKL